uniref:Protein BEX4 n=1 Tax=Cricetulus griseus TaxID=10029 RepID=A0A8C2LTJ4_CRIGR
MVSKEQQVIKDLAVQNDEKDEGREASQQSEEESHHLDEVENKKQLVPNFLWAIPNRHVNPNEGGEDVGKFVGQVREIKRKTKEQQMRPYGCFQTPEPDNHYGFCLIP